MRGKSEAQQAIFTLVTPAQVVPADHPIRRIKELADAELAKLSPVFDEMYSDVGRPSIPPEALLKSCLLIALFSVRSERQFCEQLGYNLFFRWFLDQTLNDEPCGVWGQAGVGGEYRVPAIRKSVEKAPTWG